MESIYQHPTPIPFGFPDVTSSIISGVVFIALVSLIKEPYRQRMMAMMLAVAGGVYINNGFGQYEMLAAIVVGIVAFYGSKSYKYIGIGWVFHTALDIAHHIHGYPLISTAALSSLGCAVFDVVIAIWFFTGAPSIYSFFISRLKPNS
ncbi:MAG: DUF6010 family protein [Bacteroidota bacterium]